MDEFKESVKDLKLQLSDFIKDYYTELIKLWKELTELKTNQKHLMIKYGTIVSIASSIITAIILFLIKELIKA